MASVAAYTERKPGNAGLHKGIASCDAMKKQ